MSHRASPLSVAFSPDLAPNPTQQLSIRLSTYFMGQVEAACAAGEQRWRNATAPGAMACDAAGGQALRYSCFNLACKHEAAREFDSYMWRFDKG